MLSFLNNFFEIVYFQKGEGDWFPKCPLAASVKSSDLGTALILACILSIVVLDDKLNL